MYRIVWLSVSVLTCLGFFFSSKKVNLSEIHHIEIFDNDSLLFAGEKHFRNIRQLTFGGDNAEAYFSYDGKYLIFQKTNPEDGIMCDQMYIGKVPTGGAKTK